MGATKKDRWLARWGNQSAQALSKTFYSNKAVLLSEGKVSPYRSSLYPFVRLDNVQPASLVNSIQL
jgi:hypothetical protein